jgi:hypothetical protein
MINDRYFGNLRVTTVLDCVSVPEFADAHASSMTCYLLNRRVYPNYARGESPPNLVITNQSHSVWTRAFRRAGYLSASSNYLLATSNALTAAIESDGGEERVHLTRGDGDGRIHL